MCNLQISGKIFKEICLEVRHNEQKGKTQLNNCTGFDNVPSTCSIFNYKDRCRHLDV